MFKTQFKPKDDDLFIVALSVFSLFHLLFFLIGGFGSYYEQTHILFPYSGLFGYLQAPASYGAPAIWVSFFAAIAILWRPIRTWSLGLLLLGWGVILFLDQALLTGTRLILFWITFSLFLARFCDPKARIWFFRVLFFAIYTYSGLSKINPDWVAGHPLQDYLHTAGIDFSYLRELAVGMAFAGLLFDVLIVPALLWRRTNKIAMVFVFIFHLANLFLWELYFVSLLALVFTYLSFRDVDEGEIREGFKQLKSPLLALFLLFQLLFPLRYLVYEGRGSWTLEASYFSWWLRTNKNEIDTRFYASCDGKEKEISIWKHAHKNQGRFLINPRMVLQFAHHLEDEGVQGEKGERCKNLKITTKMKRSLNKRSPTFVISPKLDLLSMPIDSKASDYVLPLPPR